MKKIILCLSILTTPNLFCIDLNDPVVQKSLKDGLLNHRKAFRQLMRAKFNNNEDISERATNLINSMENNYNHAKVYNIKIARDYGAMLHTLRRESQQ